MKELYDSFKASSGRILGTDQSFLSLRSDLAALTQFKGAFTVFLNLNPSDMHSSLMFELAGYKYTFDASDITGPPVGRPEVQEVRQIVARNAVAAANFFWTYIKCFVRLFLGWDVGTKKKIGRGYLGDVEAYYGKFETGRRGVIHAHSQALQPALEATRLRDHLSKADFRPVLLQFLEGVMSMYLPEPLHDGFLPDWAISPGETLAAVDDPINLVQSNKAAGLQHAAVVCEPHLMSQLTETPGVEDIGRALFRVVHEIQTHTHTATCDSAKRGAISANYIYGRDQLEFLLRLVLYDVILCTYKYV